MCRKIVTRLRNVAANQMRITDTMLVISMELSIIVGRTISLLLYEINFFVKKIFLYLYKRH